MKELMEEFVRGVMIPICTGSESGFRIVKRLKVLLWIRIQPQSHNTSVGVTIVYFTGSEGDPE